MKLGPTARRTNVLYLAPDGRETKLVKGAFDRSHPHLTLEFTSDGNDVRRRLREPGSFDALLIGWSVPEPDALALIAHVRQQPSSVAIIAAGDQALERYSRAGADECVTRGASFLARLPDAVEVAVARRHSAAAKTADAPAADAPKQIRVAYAGDIQFLKGALGADRSLQITPLAQALAEATAGRPAIDVVVLDHGARETDSSRTLADLKKLGLDVAVVLLVDPPDETTVLRAFESSVAECLVKTPGWTVRLPLRLGPICSRYQQLRELESLRHREARLRAMVDTLPACVVRLSGEGAILAMNAVALDLVGASELRQILRKPFQALVGPDHIDACTDFVHRVAQGERRSIEVSLTTLTGEGRLVEATAVQLPAEDGRPGSILMVLRDCSDRKRLEAALEQVAKPSSETEQRAEAVPAAPVAAESVVAEPVPAEPTPVTEAPSGTPTFVFETFSRTPQEELAVAVVQPEPAPLPAPPPPVIPPPEPRAVAPAIDPAELRAMEADLARLCGSARSTFEGLEEALRDAEARHAAELSRQQEAHARLEAEQRERWRTYESFVEAAQFGVFQVDEHGGIVESNRAFAATLGHQSPAALIAAAATMSQLTDSDAWSRAVEAWRGGSAEAIESRWKRADGALLTMRLTGRPCRRPDVQGTRLEVIAENQTAPRALESQARRARRWEDVARLTTGIAADLRGAVDDMSESVHGVRDAALDENGQRHATALQSAFGRARDLSRQLVAFGRRGAKAPETLDVNAIVRELEPVVRRLIDDHIELALELAPSLELVEAERSVLEEALVNLAVGAGDTLPAGGRISITTANLEISTSTAEAPAGEYVALTLTARGWGASTSAPAATSGAVSAQKAMARLGGTLKVEAVADESATFTVYLPQALVSISTDDLSSAAGQEAVRS